MPNSKAVDELIDREIARKLGGITDPDRKKQVKDQLDAARANGNIAEFTKVMRS